MSIAGTADALGGYQISVDPWVVRRFYIVDQMVKSLSVM